MELTSDTVKLLWSHMCERYGACVARKSSSWMMKVVNRLVPTQGFMTEYVTTFRKTIYVPFEIGDVSTGWSLAAQAAVIAHECQHLAQERRDGSWRYSWRYLTSTAARAAYETEAYRTTLEMRWALGIDEWDLYLTANRYAEGLRAYGCTVADVGLAGIELRAACDEIVRGSVKTEAARVALECLHV